jgi:hypothetical protein
MKSLLLLSFCLNTFIGFSQIDRKPPEKKDCVVSKIKLPVKYGSLLLSKVSDSILHIDTLIYNEIDSNRLIGLRTNIELLSPLLYKGFINANLLLNIGSSPETYSHFLSDKAEQILNLDKSVDFWSKECIFFGLEEESIVQNSYERIFKLTVTSLSRSSTTVYYLETTNPIGTTKMNNWEFLREAYVSCISKWYSQY